MALGGVASSWRHALGHGQGTEQRQEGCGGGGVGGDLGEENDHHHHADHRQHRQGAERAQALGDPFGQTGAADHAGQGQAAAEQQQYPPGQFDGALPVHQKHTLPGVHRDDEQRDGGGDGDAGVADPGYLLGRSAAATPRPLPSARRPGPPVSRRGSGSYVGQFAADQKAGFIAQPATCWPQLELPELLQCASSGVSVGRPNSGLPQRLQKAAALSCRSL